MRALVLIFLLTAALHATARTWTGLSGTDLNWSTAGNWSPSGAPGTADTLTFNNTCTNCNSTIDTTVTVASLTLAATYTGTLTESAGITVSGAFSETGGTFTASSFTVGGSFTFSGGTLTGSTLTFSNLSNSTFTCTGNFNSTTGITVTLNKNTAVFTLASGCTLAAGITNAATMTVQSTAAFSSTGNWPNGVINNSGSITVGGTSFTPAGNVTNSGSIDCSGCTTFTVDGTLTNNVGASILYGGSAVTIGGGWTQSGTFDISGKTLTFSNRNTATVNCSGDFNSTTGVSSVTIDKVATNLTLASGCTLTATLSRVSALTIQATAALSSSGDWPVASEASLTNSGSVTVGGTSFSPGNLTNSGTIDCSGCTAFTTASLTNNAGASITYGGAALSVGNSWTQSGTFDISGKALTASNNGTATWNCVGDFNTSTGVASVTIDKAVTAFTLASGCILTASVHQSSSITVQATASLTSTGNWPEIVSAPAIVNSGTITVGGTSMTPNNFTNNAGAVFNAPSGTSTVTGNWTNNGTFNANGGNVSFTDGNHTFAGSTTFFDLTAVASVASRTLTFTASTTQTIQGTLSLNGAAGKLLLLRSSATPSIWTINATGAQSVSYLDVKDSTATTTIYAGSTSVDSLNNTGWVFSAPPTGSVMRRRGGFVMQ